MARLRQKDTSSSARTHAKTTSTKSSIGKEVTRVGDAFSEDSRASMSGRSDAAINRVTRSFTAVHKLNATQSPGSIEDEHDESKTTLKPAPKVVKELVKDNIAIPTPIHQTLKVKLTAEDGREAYCYLPISSFKYLFQPPPDLKAASSTNRESSATKMVGQSQAAPAGNSGDNAPTESSVNCQGSMRDASPVCNLSSSVKAALETSSSSSLRKRTREDKEPCLGVNNNDEPSQTFLLGDLPGLKTFLCHRLDELTMKPLRGVVTRWVKQLEPKRQLTYGPYHKMLPTEAPTNKTPPWWPKTVLYAEAAHLSKDALLTLAVNIMLQHRDTRADESRQGQTWTSQLQRLAEAEVSLMVPDLFASFKDPAFSNAMKQRAEKQLLPNLFGIMQLHEDFVCGTSKAPMGESITWQSIPRPPEHRPRNKRPRPAPQPAPTSVVDIGQTSNL